MKIMKGFVILIFAGVGQVQANEIKNIGFTAKGPWNTIEWNGKPTNVDFLELENCNISISSDETDESKSKIEIGEFVVRFKSVDISQKVESCVFTFKGKSIINKR